jgi:hypothetical protein
VRYCPSKLIMVLFMFVNDAVGGNAPTHAAHCVDDGPLWQQGSCFRVILYHLMMILTRACRRPVT